jgi:integrase
LNSKTEHRALLSLDLEVQKALQNSSASPQTADDYTRCAYAENTYRAYQHDLKDFVAWTGIPYPFPTSSEVVKQYLVDRARDVKPSTLEHRLAALKFLHRLLDYPDPTDNAHLRTVLRGIKRDWAARGHPLGRQAPALTLAQLMAMIQAMGTSLHDRRDKAYILMGLFGAFRQSELTGLHVDQLTFVEPGIVVKMGQTKGDQLNQYRQWKAIPRGQGGCCPVEALRVWRQEAGIETGPVFRGIDRHGNILEKPLSHTTTNRIIKKWVNEAGIKNADHYSGHSLRASFITVARELRIPDPLIALQSHHRDLRVLNDYYRPEMAFTQNPAIEVMGAWAEMFENGPVGERS